MDRQRTKDRKKEIERVEKERKKEIERVEKERKKERKRERERVGGVFVRVSDALSPLCEIAFKVKIK